MKYGRSHLVTAAVLLAVAAVVALLAGREFRSMRAVEAVRPGPGLTRQALLSAYFPALAGTAGDTDVYVFEGGEAGGTVLVTGGSHPNEPAGFVSAVVLIENLRVRRGKVIVVPRKLVNIAAV